MSIQSRQGKAEFLERQATFVDDIVRQAEQRADAWERGGGPPRWIQVKNKLRRH